MRTVMIRKVMEMSDIEIDLWKCDVEDFPSSGSMEQKLRHLVGYATLAPSGHNTQPWFFGIGKDRLNVLADRERALPVVDPHDRELCISCGAAIGTFEVAARRFGMSPSVKFLPDDDNADHLAQLSLSDGALPTQNEIALFDAIQSRRTNRTAYFKELLPEDLLEDCSKLPAQFGIDFNWIVEDDVMEKIAALVAEGDRLQFDDPDFRRELGSWVRSSTLGSRDGMSGQAFGLPDILSPIGRFVIRTFDLGNGVAAGDEKKILSGSPALGVFSTAVDNVESWLNTGRALAQVLLSLTLRGYTASYLNQPIEVDALRPQLANAADLSGLPQVLLRVGRSEDVVPPSARRHLSEVIIR